MRLNLLLLTVCLLGTAFRLAAAQTTTDPGDVSTAEPMTDSSAVTMVPETTADPQVTTDQDSTSPDTSVTDQTTQLTPITEGQPPSNKLSGGEIAGIVIGSLAGVGLIGGGVYGVLKYTGRL